MTRKLGRLLVVALVVAAVVVPASVASADVGVHLECYGIQYDPMNPYHVAYPSPSLDVNVKVMLDQWDLWDYRHNGGAYPGELDVTSYINFDLRDYAEAAGLELRRLVGRLPLRGCELSALPRAHHRLIPSLPVGSPLRLFPEAELGSGHPTRSRLVGEPFRRRNRHLPGLVDF